MTLAAQLQKLFEDANRCVKGNWVVPEEEEIQALLDAAKEAERRQDQYESGAYL